MHLTMRLVIALFTFAIGVTAFAVWAALYHYLPLNEQMIPVSELRQAGLHRFYEAAAMSGDSALRQQVTEGLMCMRDDGLIDARAAEIDSMAWCVKPDRTKYRMRADYYSKFLSEHRAWAQQNLSFIEEVRTPTKAKEYVTRHSEFLLGMSPNNALNPTP